MKVTIQLARKTNARGCEPTALIKKTDRLKPQPPEVEALAGLLTMAVDEASRLVRSPDNEPYSYT